jgi:integrase
MAFVTDKSELKPGLVLFRRGDVDHRMWYCRMKIPKADRYKTVSLKTTDINVARERAFDQDADIRFRLKHDVPVFNHPFREVGRGYLLTQEARAKRGEVSAARPKKVRAIIEGALDRYVGSTQVQCLSSPLAHFKPGTPILLALTLWSIADYSTGLSIVPRSGFIGCRATGECTLRARV